MSRTDNVVKNILFGFISKTITTILSFVIRTAFIKTLGNELLGVSGLYTQILQVLSFTELGFGTALNFKMYKPVANADYVKTKSLLIFYKKTYETIALVILAFGVLLIPILPQIVNGANNINIFELRLYYCFFLFNSVVSYFSAFRFSYVNAIQKNYIQTNIDLVFNIISMVSQVLVILVFKNYLAYLVFCSSVSVIYQLFIALVLKRKYPILNLKNNSSSYVLPLNEKKEIYAEVKGLAVHQLSSIAIHSTDNIIISSFEKLGVLTVALVSNYNLIINGIASYTTIIFSSLTSGFGNLVATSDDEEFRRVFKTSNFINFWIYGFCCIALYTLTPPFVSLWLGKKFLIDDGSFALIILNLYLQGQSEVYNNARIAKGNFQRDKWLALTQALINLVLSIVLAKEIGLVGVYIGTVVSRTFYVCLRPAATYRFLFGRSCKEYFLKFSVYFIVVLIAGSVTRVVFNMLFNDVTLFAFMVSLPFVFIIPNLLFVLFFFKSKEFKEAFEMIKSIIVRSKKMVTK